MPALTQKLTALVMVIGLVNGCDFEQLFVKKQVSVEEAAAFSKIAFRGMTSASPETTFDDSRGVFVACFDLINTYKGDGLMKIWSADNNYYRKINVDFPIQPQRDCAGSSDVPSEYIIFGNLVAGEIRATWVVKWDDDVDERVWNSLGWSKWSDWSSCSVSCSSGIQQRTRHCLPIKCQGFNVEQRHCNLFSCNDTVNPLALNESRFFHPSRSRWQPVPDRPSAWRLKPNSYIWVPSLQLFSDEKHIPFPREFALFVTMRIHDSTMGTVFSLRSRRRQDTYLSLEVAGSDLKLIHAAANGTDVVRIPATIDDNKWHQIAISIRESSIVESYVDCEWSRTEVLLSHALDVPDDSDIIIGYLFTGDLEQLTIIPDPHSARLQCSNELTAIVDPDIHYISGGLKLNDRRLSRVHRFKKSYGES